ncbi:alpha/beta hydrolase [Natronospira bacteriovora]|uniref:Alpha/beta hydrolase n=1 Tax=Natronospira bacteriovora TaxID=3069753 RepID=A0ABU0W7K5_9GAMM|nr:alpha/beta hydrolase [Natronospira sp. AB-CW4]MDQ2069748.1 alpha/beta hydrolase [Natronospira sp. AB-CW4]
MLIRELLFAVAAATGTDSLSFEPCELRGSGRGSGVSAECFTVSVAEDWSRPQGNQITLRAARIPATQGDSERPPLLMIAGGPGQSALSSFVPHLRALRPIRQQHDIILVDQRGTGDSNPLVCPDAGMDSISVDEAAEHARDCLDRIGVDPRHYGTASAVRDLEVVREALGLSEWHVYGVSYGSRVALEYLRGSEAQVSSLTLDGVVPAEEILGPMLAPFAQRAVDRMLARCRDDERCRSAFPDLEGSLDRVMRRLGERDRPVRIRHPRTHEPTEVRLDRDRFAQMLRFAAYQPEMLALMPLKIHRAAEEGDWQPLAAQWLTLGESLDQTIATGMHYAVICSEDIPFLDEKDRIAQGNGFLGIDPLDLLIRICADWPVAEVGDQRWEPVRSDVPALLLSGELDPVTPPEWGEQVASQLSNSRHLVLRGKGHNVVHLGCVPFLMRDLLAGGEPGELDATCLDDMRPMPFFLDFSGPAA